MKFATIGLLSALCILSCKQKPANDAITLSHSFDKLQVINTEKEIACKLTTIELQARREGVLAELRAKVLETVETENGYAFRFAGSDETLGQLMVFIQSERQCCDFFTFKLGIQDSASPLWLEISGPIGTKSFIQAELNL